MTLFALSDAAVTQDRVEREGELPLQGGRILAADRVAVQYAQADGTAVTVPGYLVRDVIRSDAPRSYLEARESFAGGNYRDALQLWALALRASEAPAWLAPSAHYWRGESAVRLGQHREALHAFQTTLRLEPKGVFSVRARIGLARAHAHLLEIEAGKQALEQLAHDAAVSDLPKSYVPRILQARAEFASLTQAHADAAAAYASLAAHWAKQAETLAPGPARKEASLARYRAEYESGSSRLAANQRDEAKQVFSDLRGRAAEFPVADFLGLMGEAEIALAEGLPDRARINLTTALATRFESETEFPAALLLLGRSYLALAEAGENGARAEARTTFHRLLTTYPGSRSAEEAGRLLKQHR